MTSSRKIAGLLFSLIRQGYDPKQVIDHFARLAGQYGLAIDQSNLLRFIKYHLDDAASRSTVNIISSHELSEAAISQIAKLVGAKTEAGNQVVVKQDMIGGFCAEYDGRIYDATIKTQLGRLRKHLLA